MKKIILVLALLIFLTGCKTTNDYHFIVEETNDNVEVNTKYVKRGVILVVNDTEYRMKLVSSTVDTSTVGVYEVGYEYELDEEVYTFTRKVFVNDYTSPVITLNPGIDTIKQGEDWIDNGVTITDNVDTDLSYITSSNVDTSITGTYQVTYTTVDDSGNSSTVVRVVTVIE